MAETFFHFLLFENRTFFGIRLRGMFRGEVKILQKLVIERDIPSQCDKDGQFRRTGEKVFMMVHDLNRLAKLCSIKVTFIHFPIDYRLNFQYVL